MDRHPDLEQADAAADAALEAAEAQVLRTAVRLASLALDAEPADGEPWHPDDVADLRDAIDHLVAASLDAATAARPGRAEPLWERTSREAMLLPVPSTPLGAALVLLRASDRAMLDAWRARTLAPVNGQANPRDGVAAAYCTLAARGAAALQGLDARAA